MPLVIYGLRGIHTQRIHSRIESDFKKPGVRRPQAKNYSRDTFGRLPLTSYVLSVFTIISDEMWKYFMRLYRLLRSRTLLLL